MSLSGWWFQPAWKKLVNGKDDIPYIMENKSHVPNHQPVAVNTSSNPPSWALEHFSHRLSWSWSWSCAKTRSSRWRNGAESSSAMATMGKPWEKQLTTGIWPCDKLQETMTVVPCWETIENNAGKLLFNFAHRFLNKYTWYSVDNWVEKLHETRGVPFGVPSTSGMTKI